MKIFDSFPFFNELELLDIRLRMLDDVVDYFVICELPVTQTGKKKRMYFKENEEKYAQYRDKIIYVTPDQIPMLGENAVYGKWDIEYYQRNCLFYALNGRCEADDIVMMSDVDEIPNPSVIKNIKSTNYKLISKGCRLRKLAGLYFMMGGRRLLSIAVLRKHRNIYELLDSTPVGLEQRLFMYYMNLESDGRWKGTMLIKWKIMMTPQRLRKFISWTPTVENGGYHFTALGGAKRVQEKLNSLVEGYECDEKTAEELIRECVEKGTGGIAHITTEGRFHIVKKEDLRLDNKIINYIEQKYPYLFLEEN